MLTNTFRLSALVLVACWLLGSAEARHAHKAVSKKDDAQVVIIVRAKGDGLEFQIGSDRYKTKELAYFLGELRLQRDENAPIVAILEDKVELRGISEVPEMAIKAGFRNIRTYVYWPWTHKMAEIQFGPVENFSTRPTATFTKEVYAPIQ